MLAGSVTAAALAVAAAVVGRRDVRVGVGALAVAAAAVVGVDALFGGNLEVDAPFGSSAVGAGRFYGVGNIGSGFLVAGLLVAAGLALEQWGRRALPVAAGGLAAGVVAGGAPWFGADVGGVLAAVPASGTLLAGWRRGRPPARLVVPLVLATAAFLGLFLVADLSRSSNARTHLGRAAAGGGVVDEAVRKGSAALATVGNPMSLVAVIGVATVVGARLRLSGRPALAAAAWALGVAGVVGSAANDSGLLVAAAVTAVAWPALVAVASAPGPAAPPPVGPRPRVARP
jgi:hypothetical protein